MWSSHKDGKGVVEAMSAFEIFSLVGVIACFINAVRMFYTCETGQYRVFAITGWSIAFMNSVVAFVCQWQLMH